MIRNNEKFKIQTRSTSQKQKNYRTDSPPQTRKSEKKHAQGKATYQDTIFPVIAFFDGEFSISRKAIKAFDVKTQDTYNIQIANIRDEYDNIIEAASLIKGRLLELSLDWNYNVLSAKFMSELDIPSIYQGTEENSTELRAQNQNEVTIIGAVLKLGEKIEIYCESKGLGRSYKVEPIHFTKEPKIGDAVRLIVRDGKIIEVTLSSDTPSVGFVDYGKNSSRQIESSEPVYTYQFSPGTPVSKKSSLAQPYRYQNVDFPSDDLCIYDYTPAAKSHSNVPTREIQSDLKIVTKMQIKARDPKMSSVQNHGMDYKDMSHTLGNLKIAGDKRLSKEDNLKIKSHDTVDLTQRCTESNSWIYKDLYENRPTLYDYSTLQTASVKLVQVPILQAQVPILQAQVPILQAQVPIQPAKVPIQPAKVPILPAKVPILPAQVPIQPAKVPILPAQVPIQPAKVPILPAQAPIQKAQVPIQKAQVTQLNHPNSSQLLKPSLSNLLISDSSINPTQSSQIIYNSYSSSPNPILDLPDSTLSNLLHSPIKTISEFRLPIYSLKLYYPEYLNYHKRVDVLSSSYRSWRRSTDDGNSFYRSLGSSYLEYLCSNSTDIQELEYFISRLNNLPPNITSVSTYLHELYQIKQIEGNSIYRLQQYLKLPSFDISLIESLRKLGYIYLSYFKDLETYKTALIDEGNYTLNRVQIIGEDAQNEELMLFSDVLGVIINKVTVFKEYKVQEFKPRNASYISTTIHLLKKSRSYNVLYTQEQNVRDQYDADKMVFFYR